MIEFALIRSDGTATPRRAFNCSAFNPVALCGVVVTVPFAVVVPEVDARRVL
jgi:hypothetical protein